MTSFTVGVGLCCTGRSRRRWPSLPAAWRGLEDAGAGAAGGRVDDVRAGVEHALGGRLALGRVVEAGAVRRLGQVLAWTLTFGLAALTPGLEAGLELVDQRHVDAADEADRCRSCVFSAAATPTR